MVSRDDPVMMALLRPGVSGGYPQPAQWHRSKARTAMTVSPPDAATISEIIEMALSDHVSFAMISAQHGLGPDQVKALMRAHLKPGSYRAWRKRVRMFSDRREVYK